MSLAVKKYSTALFDVCIEENCLEQVFEQFSGVYEELRSNEQFQKIMISSAISANEKKEFFNNSLKDANPYLLNFLMVLADKGHTDELMDIFMNFEELYKENHNILDVTAITAVALSEEELAQIKDKIANKYNKTVIMAHKVDPSILGGMVLYVGNRMLDASLKSKLNGLKNTMKQSKIS